MLVAPLNRSSVNPTAAPDSLLALTGIRGLAAWWVVIYHFRDHFPDDPYHIFSSVIAHGYLAVDLFFELSGFIIALNYMHTFRSLSFHQAVHFLGLRLARVYPLYIFMLLLFLLNPLAILLASSSGVVSSRYDPGYFALSVLMIQNWGFTSTLAWNVPAWSISTEWFAYLVFPGLAWLLARVATTRMRSASTAAALLLLLALGLMAMHGTLGSNIAQNGLIRCLCEFAAGMSLYQLWRQQPGSRRTATTSVVTFGACIATYIVTDLPDFSVVPLGFLCLIYALAVRDSQLSRLFSCPPMVRLGLWSYATYMVHYFVKDWVTFLLVRGSINPVVPPLAFVATTLIASVVLYHYLEVPGRQAVRKLLARPVPAAGGSA